MGNLQISVIGAVDPPVYTLDAIAQRGKLLRKGTKREAEPLSCPGTALFYGLPLRNC
jgi:hypothetical protein